MVWSRLCRLAVRSVPIAYFRAKATIKLGPYTMHARIRRKLDGPRFI